jgi:polyphosphate:AMP phosphotransferase
MAQRRPQRTSTRTRVTEPATAGSLSGLRDRVLAAQFELKQKGDRAVVLIVTGIPAAGRSEVVNELLSWLDPKLVTVYGFGARNDAERERPPLWRYWRILPPKGRIAVLHGACYVDLWHRVLSFDGKGPRWPKDAQRAADRIRQLERMLVADGVGLAKVHLHVPAATQARRLRQLEADKATRWRVTREDRRLARHHDAVERALGKCLQATDQPVAPWHVVDGTDAGRRALAVGQCLLGAMTQALPADSAAVPGPPSPSPSDAVRLTTRTRAARPSDEEYEAELERLQGRLALASRRKRFARHAVVAVFEGMDAAGKGGAIRRVTAALDARQYRVVPIAAPAPEELAKPYLWRFWFHLPPRGHYTIFDRSWYGRVLVERVRGFAPQHDWQRAYAEIVEFERQLAEHGTILAKFWMAVSRAEQLERFDERERDLLKRFKVDPEDRANREHWDVYQQAAREMIARTDAPHAPWTVIPADDKRAARLHVLRTLCERIDAALD